MNIFILTVILIWAGSYDSGLFKFNESEDLFEFPFSEEDENAELINTGRINHVMERESGNLMISGGNGLVEYYPESNKLTAVSRQFVSDDLMKTCRTTLEDQNGSLWIGTDNGIFLIEDDRLIDVDNRFDRIWFLSQIDTGEMFAASPSGLNIGFQSIDFSKGSRTRLFYRLKGFSDEWIDVSHEHRVNFVNLPHGEYEFNLKAVKNDSIVSEILSLNIGIHPAFIETPEFILLIGLILLMVIALVVLYIQKLNGEIVHRQDTENDFAVLNANLEE